MKKIAGLILITMCMCAAARAQRADVLIQLDEPFFDALLDGVFAAGGAPEFPLALNDAKSQNPNDTAAAAVSPSPVSAASPLVARFDADGKPEITHRKIEPAAPCEAKIRLLREIDGTRTAVRLRDGQIVAPLAFSGNYDAPIVGCIAFSGVARVRVDLEFDQPGQRLIGRATVLDVELSGAGGLGSSALGRLVQSAIDKKVNPIEVLKLDKLTFNLPLPNNASLQMKAVAIRTVVSGGVAQAAITFEFAK